MNQNKNALKITLSKYLRDLRKRRSITQEAMAENLRISARAYSDLEQGKYCISALSLLFLISQLDSQETSELLLVLREVITDPEEDDSF